jgi:hypothetical protein
VQAADAGADADGAVERGDVGVADDGFGFALQGVVVDGVEQAHGAVAAAEAPDGVDAIVAQRVVQIGETVRVAAGEVVGFFVGVSADHRLPAEGGGVGGGAIYVGGNSERTGSGDESDARAGLEFFEWLHDERGNVWRQAEAVNWKRLKLVAPLVPPVTDERADARPNNL